MDPKPTDKFKLTMLTVGFMLWVFTAWMLMRELDKNDLLRTQMREHMSTQHPQE